MKALNFNQFIFEVANEEKFFTFLGDYVPTEHVRKGWSWRSSRQREHAQRYRNQRDSRFLNLLEFIYKAGSEGRSANEVRGLLKSWGLSGGGNILYATEWGYSSDDVGSRRTGVFPAHCTKNSRGKWVLSDTILKKFFYTKELTESGASKDEIDQALSLFDLGIDPSERVDDIDDYLKNLDI